VLVDEFQDTDPLQEKCCCFWRNAQSPRRTVAGRSVGAGKLFIVGDPKQSIYRFRGADIRAYEAFVSL
jgi:ATP-dependent helicase/nuclease subunit A